MKKSEQRKQAERLLSSLPESDDPVGVVEQFIGLVQHAALSSRDAEIREVLEGLAIRRNIDHKSWCWCQKRWDATKPHNENCAAARALWNKLQPPTSPTSEG